MTSFGFFGGSLFFNLGGKYEIYFSGFFYQKLNFYLLSASKA